MIFETFDAFAYVKRCSGNEKDRERDAKKTVSVPFNFTLFILV